MAIVIAGCSRTPEYVIPESKLVPLLADIYIAESVVDVNYSEYRDDSVRKLLKQSIFMKYDVTQAQFDTTMFWFGHNLDEYIAVNNKVIKELDRRGEKLGAVIRQTSSSVAGDSADVWPLYPYTVINSRQPSRTLAFELEPDENYVPGDEYTWRLKLVGDNSHTVNWTFVGEYTDNSVDWFNSQSINSDWAETTFISDTTRILKSLRGMVAFTPYGSSVPTQGKVTLPDIYIDSISLVRKRFNPSDQHLFSRTKHYPPLEPAGGDSVAVTVADAVADAE